MAMSDAAVAIVEVGPRDGFQSIEPLIPTDRKIAVVNALHAAGVRRMEATSFVSPSALPQLADAEEVLAAYLSRWQLPAVSDSKRLEAG